MPGSGSRSRQAGTVRGSASLLGPWRAPYLVSGLLARSHAAQARGLADAGRRYKPPPLGAPRIEGACCLTDGAKLLSAVQAGRSAGMRDQSPAAVATGLCAGDDQVCFTYEGPVPQLWGRLPG